MQKQILRASMLARMMAFPKGKDASEVMRAVKTRLSKTKQPPCKTKVYLSCFLVPRSGDVDGNFTFGYYGKI